VSLFFALFFAQVDEIRVLWPSGTTQTLTDVTVDQFLEIIEPAP